MIDWHKEGQHHPDRGESQLGQTAWVLENSSRNKPGYFIEAGALDGIRSSNTYLLEMEYEWTGICCEPNPTFHKDLNKSRNCLIDHRCIYNTTGDVVTFYCDEHLGGTYDDFKAEKNRLDRRLRANQVEVSTVTLNDLLMYHSAPKTIDYISLDTEGSELKILQAFDISSYDIGLWTIEHNTGARKDGGEYLSSLKDLFSDWGYSHERVQHDVWFYK